MNRPLKVDVHNPAQWKQLVQEWTNDDGAFLDLTRAGSEEKPVPMDFLDTILRLAGSEHLGSISASGAVFEKLSLDDWHFAGAFRLDGASVLGKVSALRAVFDSEVWFDNASFRSTVNFGGAKFGSHCSFSGAIFSDGAKFRQTSFSDGRLFSDATFHNDALFKRASFKDTALFNRAIFKDGIDLDSATFSKRVDFTEAQLSREVRLRELYVESDTQIGGRKMVVEEAPTYLRISLHGSSEGPLTVDLDQARLNADSVVHLGSGCQVEGALIVRAPCSIQAESRENAGSIKSIAGSDITAPFRVGRYVSLQSTIWGDQDLTRVELADPMSFARRSETRFGRARLVIAGDVEDQPAAATGLGAAGGAARVGASMVSRADAAIDGARAARAAAVSSWGRLGNLRGTATIFRNRIRRGVGRSIFVAGTFSSRVSWATGVSGFYLSRQSAGIS